MPTKRMKPALSTRQGGRLASSLQSHPLSERLPPMTDADYQSLKLSIAALGKLTHPIVLLDGKILDGRHRHRACAELGITPRFLTFKPAWGSPVEYVIAQSAHRHLSAGQKAWSAAKFSDDLASLRKTGERRFALSGKSAAQAAAQFGVSARQVEIAKTLMDKAPALFARLATEPGFNVNRAMHLHARESLRALHRQAMAKSPADMSNCRLVAGDCIQRLEEVPSKSVGCVFADPPYNLKKRYDSDRSRDARSDAEFLRWCKTWLAGCVRTLTMDGSIFVMINSRYAARVEIIMRDLGLFWRNTIVWADSNPEHQRGNFSDAARLIHYFTHSERAYIWNDDVRVPSRRNQLGDKRGIDAGKVPDSVWLDIRLPGNSRDRVPFPDAPPQLPVAIPERCILVSTNPGDTVLDPFNGNGTTGIAALANGRKYIGIDQSKKYLDQSRRWISAQLQSVAVDDSRPGREAAK